MRLFLTVWFGQLISMVGTNLTNFALSIWVFQQTNSVTSLSLMLLSAKLPQLLMTPYAGVIVDRIDRRVAMILSDLGSGMATILIAILLFTGNLEVWMLYPILALGGMSESFQWPAFSAATTLIVSKRDLGRAAGLNTLANAAANLLAPMLAGVLLGVVGLWAVLCVDAFTFLVAISTLLLVRFPPPKKRRGKSEKKNVGKEMREGWNFIRERKGLLYLLLYFGTFNFATSVIPVVSVPMILGFASEATMGAVLSFAGLGMLVGAAIMSAWRGPKSKIMGIVYAAILAGLALILLGLRPSVALVMIGGFLNFAVTPATHTCSQALWQLKVAPEMQGRVFAIRRFVAMAPIPLAYVLAGPLVDSVFEPAMAEGGALAGLLGPIIGTGEGRGAALLVICIGLMSIVGGLVAYLVPRIRHVETELPDVVSSRRRETRAPAPGQVAQT